MTTAITAIFEGGVLRPTAPMQLADGTRVELIVVSADTNGPDSRKAATILAELAALPTSGGDPRTSEDHDRILYGDQGAR